MNVVYSCSDYYARIASVSMMSLFENNRDVEDLEVFVIGNGVKDGTKAELRKLVARYGRSITFLEMPDFERLAGVKVVLGRADLSTFSSSFLPQILPKSVEKVLLIDGDTLVRKSLWELWELDLKDYYIAGSDDVKSKWYRRTLGIDDDAPYINCGVLLINVKKFREDDMQRKALDYIASRNGKILYTDQSVNNVICSPFIHLLPLKFNSLSCFFAYGYEDFLRYRRPSLPINSEAFYEATHDPAVVHFSDSALLHTRPWLEGCEHPFANEYEAYMDRLGFKKETSQRRDSISRKLIFWFYHMLPRPFTSRALGFFQAVVQPKLYFKP